LYFHQWCRRVHLTKIGWVCLSVSFSLSLPPTSLKQSHYVVRTVLEHVNSNDPPALVSWVTGTIGLCHHAWLISLFLVFATGKNCRLGILFLKFVLLMLLIRLSIISSFSTADLWSMICFCPFFPFRYLFCPCWFLGIFFFFKKKWRIS
jgi:hypothetical protein